MANAIIEIYPLSDDSEMNILISRIWEDGFSEEWILSKNEAKQLRNKLNEVLNNG